MSLATKTKAFVAAVVLVGSGSFALARMQAGDERSIPYQGVLEENGVAKNGPVTLRFTLFAGVAGGEPLWTEDQDVDVSAGRFSAVLGDGDGDVLDDEILSTPALFLEVAVLDGTSVTTLSPRQEIVPVPLAARAANADRAFDADNAVHANSADTATRAASVANGSITRASLGNDIRFAARLFPTVGGGMAISRQTPPNWLTVSRADPGDVALTPNVAANYICVVSHHASPNHVASIEVTPLQFRVLTQNLAGTRVSLDFSVICEVP